MQSLLILFTVACSLAMLEAAYLRNGNTKNNDAAAQQPSEDAHLSYFMEQYSPEVARILSNPRLQQELYEAIQQIQQQPEPEYKSGAPSKRAQTFVRFGKRSQTFVRFGRK